MRRHSTYLLFALAGVLPAFAVQAAEPTQTATGKAKEAQPERVHLGSASVTVVDEHEAIDDVISRIHDRKAETAATDKAKTSEHRDQGSRSATATTATTATDIHQGNERASLRAQRDRAAARADAERIKDERRERAASTRTRLEQKQHR